MQKIEYKIKKGSKSETKSVELIDLSWGDWCKAQDLRLLMSNPNGAMFTNAAKFVQLYLGKSDEEMETWRDSMPGNDDFFTEVMLLAKEIGQSVNAKKK